MKTATASAMDKIAFLVNGGCVKRYHTVITTREQTIAEHSFGVAWFVYWLTDGEPSVSLLMAALSHDMAEQATGDMPGHIKRELGLQELMKGIERDFLRKNNAHFELNEYEKAVLDCADRMEGLLFCICQRELGNINVTTPAYNFIRYMTELKSVLDNNKNYRSLLEHLERIWSNAQGK